MCKGEFQGAIPAQNIQVGLVARSSRQQNSKGGPSGGDEASSEMYSGLLWLGVRFGPLGIAIRLWLGVGFGPLGIEDMTKENHCL